MVIPKKNVIKNEQSGGQATELRSFFNGNAGNLKAPLKYFDEGENIKSSKINYKGIKSIISDLPVLKVYIDSCIFAAFGNLFFFRPNTLEELIEFMKKYETAKEGTDSSQAQSPQAGKTFCMYLNLLVNYQELHKLIGDYSDKTFSEINELIKRNYKIGVIKR